MMLSTVRLPYMEGAPRLDPASYIWQVRLDPHSAETYADMGTAYLARRELLASQREYERALQLQPANALAHANLVYLRTKLCDWTGRHPPPLPTRPQSPPLVPLPPCLTSPPATRRRRLPMLLAYTY